MYILNDNYYNRHGEKVRPIVIDIIDGKMVVRSELVESWDNVLGKHRFIREYKNGGEYRYPCLQSPPDPTSKWAAPPEKGHNVAS